MFPDKTKLGESTMNVFFMEPLRLALTQLRPKLKKTWLDQWDNG